MDGGLPTGPMAPQPATGPAGGADSAGGPAQRPGEAEAAAALGLGVNPAAAVRQRPQPQQMMTNRGEQRVQQPVTTEEKVGRNDPCPCGSGKKYKQCHGRA